MLTIPILSRPTIAHHRVSEADISGSGIFQLIDSAAVEEFIFVRWLEEVAEGSFDGADSTPVPALAVAEIFTTSSRGFRKRYFIAPLGEVMQ
jgi:hypothetical protein